MKPARMRSNRSTGLAVTRLSGGGPSEAGLLSASTLAASAAALSASEPSASCAAGASAAPGVEASEAVAPATDASGEVGPVGVLAGPWAGSGVMRETLTGGARLGSAGWCAQPLSRSKEAPMRARNAAGGGSGIDFARLNLHPAAGFVSWYG